MLSEPQGQLLVGNNTKHEFEQCRDRNYPTVRLVIVRKNDDILLRFQQVLQQTLYGDSTGEDHSSAVLHDVGDGSGHTRNALQVFHLKRWRLILPIATAGFSGHCLQY